MTDTSHDPASLAASEPQAQVRRSALLDVVDGAVEATGQDAGTAAHYGDPVREQRALARLLTERVPGVLFVSVRQGGEIVRDVLVGDTVRWKVEPATPKAMPASTAVSARGRRSVPTANDAPGTFCPVRTARTSESG